MVFLLRALGRLPLTMLYGVARWIYFVTFHLLRWRRDLAARNIARSFPEKTDAERAAILRQSYRNMSEVFVELLWGWRASAGGGAHFGIPIDAVYKPIRVPSLDAYMRDARSRFGGKPIPIKSFAFELLRRASEVRGYALVADQTPLKNMAKHWTRFLNQDTAFFVGAEKIARFLDAPVVYVAMRRIERGRYAVHLHVLAEPPYDGNENAPLTEGSAGSRGSEDTWITERYARKLEQEIRSSPADWLWVHNKWKYPKPETPPTPNER